mmetsp:Transcript_16537/g.35843  ORF Transcript_16537/g.35843 Transcript_16537/m.35843 type:complete len:237 (-) Transcript_16537:481-1191(-)
MLLDGGAEEEEQVECGGAGLHVCVLGGEHGLAEERGQDVAELGGGELGGECLQTDEPLALARCLAERRRLLDGRAQLGQTLAHEALVGLGHSGRCLVGLFLEEGGGAAQVRADRPPEEDHVGLLQRRAEGDEQLEETALRLEDLLFRLGRGRGLEELSQDGLEEVSEEGGGRDSGEGADGLLQLAAAARKLGLVDVEEEGEEVLSVLADGLEAEGRLRREGEGGRALDECRALLSS